MKKNPFLKMQCHFGQCWIFEIVLKEWIINILIEEKFTFLILKLVNNIFTVLQHYFKIKTLSCMSKILHIFSNNSKLNHCNSKLIILYAHTYTYTHRQILSGYPMCLIVYLKSMFWRLLSFFHKLAIL